MHSGSDDGSTAWATPADALAALPPAMHRSLELAWEAYCTGNVAVGAVVTDANGVIVAEGRNRVSDESAPPGRLSGTFIAHAEIDALGNLRPGDYLDHTLWTTLQPCLLCTSATVLTKIGHVTYLAPDTVWDGIEDLPTLNAQTARRWPTRTGPLGGPLQVFAQVLPAAWFDRPGPAGVSVLALRRSSPAGHRLLRHLPDRRTWTALDLPEALEVIWDELREAAAEVRSS